MDRFIEEQHKVITHNTKNLKSNMDRFIVISHLSCRSNLKYLKSNMDRFIVYDVCRFRAQNKQFKIQYGQIYRISSRVNTLWSSAFKIQYGQIYSGIGTEEAESLINLKSNMDRFIGELLWQAVRWQVYLKSNMDRFIVLAAFVGLGLISAFKIQYGQIYSTLSKMFPLPSVLI